MPPTSLPQEREARHTFLTHKPSNAMFLEQSDEHYAKHLKQAFPRLYGIV